MIEDAVTGEMKEQHTHIKNMQLYLYVYIYTGQGSHYVHHHIMSFNMMYIIVYNYLYLGTLVAVGSCEHDMCR